MSSPKPVLPDVFKGYLKDNRIDSRDNPYVFIKTIRNFRPRYRGREHYDIMDIYLDYDNEQEDKGNFLFAYQVDAARAESTHVLRRNVRSVFYSNYRWRSVGRMILNELEIMAERDLR